MTPYGVTRAQWIKGGHLFTYIMYERITELYNVQQQEIGISYCQDNLIELHQTVTH